MSAGLPVIVRTQQISNFCALVVRDYLKSKGMEVTLAAFNKEQIEEPDLSAWCSIAQRLELPELLEAQEKSILEVLTVELLAIADKKEKKIKIEPVEKRDKVDAYHHDISQDKDTLFNPQRMRRPKKPGVPSTRKKDKCKSTVVEQNAVRTTKKYNPYPTKSIQIKTTPKLLGSGNTVMTRENWISTDQRERIVQRNLRTLKANMDELTATENFIKNQERHQHVSDLDVCRQAEKYGLKRKKACGLCELNFSQVNLVLQVPFKAVHDLRLRWSQEDEHNASESDHSIIDRTKQKMKSQHKTCIYDEVAVCLFCSQFFRLGQQEVYRPSYEQQVAEDHRRCKQDQQAKATAYWDPIKQIEAERADEAKLSTIPTLSPPSIGAVIPMGPM